MEQLLSAAIEASGNPPPKIEQNGMDAGYPAPPPAEPSTAHHSEEQSLLDKLREFVESKGLTLDEGWRVEIKQRSTGNSAGTKDAYYFSPDGKRYRSRQEIARSIGLAPDVPKVAAKPVTVLSRTEALSAAHQRLASMELPWPISDDDDILLLSFGDIDEQCSLLDGQIIPINLITCWNCLDAGLLFNVTRPARASGKGSNGADHAAKKQRREGQGGGGGVEFVVYWLPADSDMLRSCEHESYKKYGRLLGVGSTPYEVYKQLAVQQHQVLLEEEEAKEEAAAQAMLDATTAVASPEHPIGGQSDLGQGEDHDLKEEDDEDDEDYDSEVERAAKKRKGGGKGGNKGGAGKGRIPHADVLVMLPDLSAVAGITRFGLADVVLLQAIEGMDGSDEIPGYQYVEEHSSWEIWGNKLLKQISKDQRDVQTALKHVKPRPSSSNKSPTNKKRKANDENVGVNAAGKKVRAGVSREKDRQAIERVMDRMLKEIEVSGVRAAKAQAAAEAKQAAKKDKAAAKAAQRAGKREKEAQEKQKEGDAAERKDKTPVKKEDPVMLDDLELPGAATAPPPAAPLGCGALSPDLLPWVAEAWGLLRRFKSAVGLQDLPSLHDLEAAIANPGSSEKAYSMITEVHCALVRTLVEEAFHAAVETETSINEDAKLRDVQHACPVVTPDTFLELARRYIILSHESMAAHALDASGGSGVAVSSVLLNSRHLANLDARALLQCLLGGPFALYQCTGMLPHGAAPAADNAKIRMHAGNALAHALTLLGFETQQADGTHNTPPLQQQLHMVLSELVYVKGGRNKHDKTGKHATAELLCACADEAAAVAKAGRPRDLLRVAANINAGVYARWPGGSGLQAFASDVHATCALWGAALKKSHSMFATAMLEAGGKPLGDAVNARLTKLISEIEQGAFKVPTIYTEKQQPTTAPDDTTTQPSTTTEQGQADTQEEESIVLQVPQPPAHMCQPIPGCCVCWADTDDARMLLCDGCNVAYHVYCLEPPLSAVPDGSWLCPGCAAEEAKVDHQFDPDPEDLSQLFNHGAALLCAPDLAHLATHLNTTHTYLDLTPRLRVDLLKTLCALILETVEVRSVLARLREHVKECKSKIACTRASGRPKGGKKKQDAKAEGKQEGSGKQEGDGGKQEGDGGEEGKELVNAGEEGQQRDASPEKPIIPPEEVARIVAGLQEEIAAASVREQPIGVDRHRRRYWLLGGYVEQTRMHPGILVVEGALRTGAATNMGAATKDHAGAAAGDNARVAADTTGHSQPHQTPRTAMVTSPTNADVAMSDAATPLPPPTDPTHVPTHQQPSSHTLADDRTHTPHMHWFSSMADVDALLQWLNPQGPREGPLRGHVQAYLAALQEAYGGHEGAFSASVQGLLTAAAEKGEEEEEENDDKDKSDDDKEKQGEDTVMQEAPPLPHSPDTTTAVPSPHQWSPTPPATQFKHDRTAVLTLLDTIPGDSYDLAKATPQLLDGLGHAVQSATSYEVLLAAVVVLEEVLLPGCFKPWWRPWSLTPGFFPGSLGGMMIHTAGGGGGEHMEKGDTAGAGGGVGAPGSVSVGPGALHLRLAMLQGALRRPPAVEIAGGGVTARSTRGGGHAGGAARGGRPACHESVDDDDDDAHDDDGDAYNDDGDAYNDDGDDGHEEEEESEGSEDSEERRQREDEDARLARRLQQEEYNRSRGERGGRRTQRSTHNTRGGGRVIEHTLRGNHPRRAAAARVARYRDIDSEEEEYDSDGDSWDEGGGRGLRRSTRGRR